MVSNDPSDGTLTDREDGDRDGSDDEAGDGDEPDAIASDDSLESADGDEAAEPIPEDVPGRPAGTPDDATTSGAASVATDSGDGAAETDAVGGVSATTTDDGAEVVGDAGADDPTAATTRSDLAPDEQYCYSCGAVIKREAVLCPECGVSQEQSASSDKDPGVAALLSAVGFIVPIAAGAGQIYNGEIGKGIAFSVVQVINVFLVFLLIGFITYPLVGIWAIYDAYQNAQ